MPSASHESSTTDGGAGVVILSQTIPALPVRDIDSAITNYRERLGFTAVYADDGFAVLRRDTAQIHLWHSGDESWEQRDWIEQDSDYDGLRNEPRFQQLLAKLK